MYWLEWQWSEATTPGARRHHRSARPGARLAEDGTTTNWHPVARAAAIQIPDPLVVSVGACGL